MKHQMCRLCHTQHAIWEPHKFASKVAKAIAVEAPPISKQPLTRKRPVNEIINKAVNVSGCPRCAELEEEVRALKRQLAQRGEAVPKGARADMAAYMREWRARRKAVVDE